MKYMVCIGHVSVRALNDLSHPLDLEGFSKHLLLFQEDSPFPEVPFEVLNWLISTKVYLFFPRSMISHKILEFYCLLSLDATYLDMILKIIQISKIILESYVEIGQWNQLLNSILIPISLLIWYEHFIKSRSKRNYIQTNL